MLERRGPWASAGQGRGCRVPLLPVSRDEDSGGCGCPAHAPPQVTCGCAAQLWALAALPLGLAVLCSPGSTRSASRRAGRPRERERERMRSVRECCQFPVLHGTLPSSSAVLRGSPAGFTPEATTSVSHPSVGFCPHPALVSVPWTGLCPPTPNSPAEARTRACWCVELGALGGEWLEGGGVFLMRLLPR